MTQEIRSNKLTIVGQSLAIFIACAGAGAALEYVELLQTSPLGQLSAAVGLPVVGAALGLVGLAIAVTMAIDSWSFTVKLIPAYGAGIALKDKDEWLNGFVGSADNRDKLVTISSVLAATYGCDIAFVNKRLRCGSKAFLDLLSSKTGLPVSSKKAA